MKTKLKCDCGYIWDTSSLNMYVTCPNCQHKIRRDTHVVREDKVKDE